jgi:hypothetical protein
VAAAKAATVAHDGARLSLGAGALSEQTEIGVTPLTEEQLAPLGVGWRT